MPVKYKIINYKGGEIIMSEVVYYKGILKPVDFLVGETLEERCKRIIGDVELEDCYDSYQEKLMDDFDYYESYVIHNDILYSVEKNRLDPEQSFFMSKRNDNGTVNFEVRYYNGGTSFDEAIEYALKNKERK